MNILYYLFARIPSLLFEPIAVGSMLGFAAAVIVFRKSRSMFFWPVLTSILFMLGWRLGFHSLMLSKRYASILIYPAVLLTVWFCFQLDPFCRWLLQKNWARKFSGYARFCSVIPYLFILGLTIACTIKALHYNSYGDVPLKISQDFLKDSRDCKNLHVYFVTGKDVTQIRYYAKLSSPDQFTLRSENDSQADQFMETTLLEKRNIPGRHYFFVTKHKHEPEFTPSQKVLSHGKWTVTARYWTARKKNREKILYCYEPLCKNIKEWHGAVPSPSPGNLCVNGDFEKSLTGAALEQRLDYYKKIKSSDFYTTQGRLFPCSWWLGVTPPQNGKTSEMCLSGEKAVAGNYSLEIKSNGTGYPGVNCPPIPKQNGRYTGFLYAREDSVVKAHSCYWNSKGKKSVVLDTVTFQLSAGKLYQFNIPVQAAEIPENEKNIFIVIACSGDILVDNVEFIPLHNDLNQEKKP